MLRATASQDTMLQKTAQETNSLCYGLQPNGLCYEKRDAASQDTMLQEANSR